MRAHLRQFAGLVAIITIAVHTGLWGIAAAHPVASGVDPFSVICHSGTTDDTTEQPANQAPARTHACDHCNLCGTAPLSSLPAAVSVLKLAPAPLLHRLVAANVLASAGIVSRSNFARGPPVFA